MVATVRFSPRVGGSSPWDRIQTVEQFEGAPRGVVFVTTAGHGGAWVPDEIAETMPAGLRTIGERDAARGGWWYEEDCAVYAVMLSWPEGRAAEHLVCARACIAETYPKHAEGGSGCGEVARGRFHSCPVRS